MRDQLQELVRRYQAGDDVRGDIEKELFNTIENVVYVVFNEYSVGENDVADIIKKSINDALRTYVQERGAVFRSWFYTTFKDDLEHLKNKYDIEHKKGVLIQDIETFYKEAENMTGDVFDLEILKELRFITETELDEMSDRQLKFIAMSCRYLKGNMRITNKVAAEALNLKEGAIENYKKDFKKMLAGSYRRLNEHIEQRKTYQGEDLPELLNEYGNPDPTPREAARNIKRGKS